MSKKRASEIFFNVLTRMRKPYYQGVAAELAFFFLLSMVPLFIIVAEVLGIFSISIDVLKELVTQYVTAGVAENIIPYLTYTPSGTISILFVVFALWAASKAQFSMIRIANFTYTGLYGGRGFFRERFRAIVSVALTVLLVAVALIILVGGDFIVSVVTLYASRFLGETILFQQIWLIIRWPISMAVFMLAINYIYYTLPTKKWPYRSQTPGAVVATAGILVVTWVYSFYITHFSNYDLLYGSLATIVGLLMWFYFMGFVLVIGIVFNAAWEETKHPRQD